MRSVSGLPEVNVLIAGRPCPKEVATSIARIEVSQRLSRPSQCDLLLEDPPVSLGDFAIELGSELRVERAPSGELFTGDIVSLKYGFGPDRRRRVWIIASDRLDRLNRSQTIRSYPGSSLVEMATEMAAELGLEVCCHGALEASDFVVHGQGSHLDFLVRRAERAGAYLSVRGDALHLSTLTGYGDPIDLDLGESLLEATVELSRDTGYRSVRALAWNPCNVRQVESQVARSEHETGPAVEPGGDYTLTDLPLSAEPEARAAARAAIEAGASRERVLRGVAAGDERLRPGTRVRVAGLGAAVPEDYVLTSVIHTFDPDKGYLSELSSEPPGPSPSRHEALRSELTLGEITRVDDPEGLGRVKASLPAFGTLETDWLHVVSPGAGARKGLCMLPDVSDTVLVACLHGDPARAVVLGGLYGAAGLPAPAVELGGVRHYSLSTPAGNALQIDDADTIMRLQNGHGSFIEMSREEVRVHAKVNLVLEAPGQDVVIRGRTIDFQRSP